MQPQAALPSQSYVWNVLGQRFSDGLIDRASELWRLSGLDEEYGPLGENFTGERETQEMSDEIAGHLLIALDTQVRQTGNCTNRGVGRPRDVIIPYLGPNLLSFFLRCHDSAGRKSVLTSIEGQLAQMEAGPFFEFVKIAIEPLNDYLIELGRKPVSAARLARFALEERRRNSSAARRRLRHKKSTTSE